MKEVLTGKKATVTNTKARANLHRNTANIRMVGRNSGTRHFTNPVTQCRGARSTNHTTGMGRGNCAR